MPDLWGNTSEEEMYQMALAVPLADKVQMAIALIREFEKQALALHEDGYYVAFSGGKDSIVMERLFSMAGVKYKAWYNNVTIDPPELVQFIKRYYPEVRWNNPAKNLPAMMVDIGIAPSRLARWCCLHYKEQGGRGTFRATGVRASESPRRKVVCCVSFLVLCEKKKANGQFCLFVNLSLLQMQWLNHCRG